MDVEERDCAEFFINWYNHSFGAKYLLKETKAFCPDLPGKNWDYVPQQKGDSNWIAIEVKGTRFPPLLRDRERWEDYFGKVKAKVGGKLPGTFRLDGLALPVGNSRNLEHEARPFARLLLESARNLKVGERAVILGTSVKVCRTSDAGSSLSYGYGAPLPWYGDGVEGEETRQNLDGAARQLQAAKHRGAVKCLLLFSAHAPRYDVGNLERTLVKNQEDLCGIVDDVFLVDLGAGPPIHLWPPHNEVGSLVPVSAV